MNYAACVLRVRGVDRCRVVARERVRRRRARGGHTQSGGPFVNPNYWCLDLTFLNLN